MDTIEEFMSYKHLRRDNHDLTHLGIYGPSKQSVLVHLDNWVLKDVLFDSVASLITK
jgi:hypothetical protein